ncbi:hypothetical protein K501DRAFT_278554 [Backusella circina FSU 941]|nr:hypothetical protein K501DRAFT_278554 [Backusella circina FSU 941]
MALQFFFYFIYDFVSIAFQIWYRYRFYVPYAIILLWKEVLEEMILFEMILLHMIAAHGIPLHFTWVILTWHTLEFRHSIQIEKNNVLVVASSNNEKNRYLADKVSGFHPDPISHRANFPAMKSLPSNKYLTKRIEDIFKEPNSFL